MKLEDLKTRVEQLVQLGHNVLNSKKIVSASRDQVDYGLSQEFRSSTLSFIRNCFGESHPFYSELFNVPINSKIIHYDEAVREFAILSAAKQEINGSWLFTVKGLVSAEIFSDFLEMAIHLLDEGYKDAAAVIIGGVLEDTMRKLAELNNIEITNEKGKSLTIEPLNVELTKKGVYSPLIKQQITTWGIIRNNAAHAQYDKYDVKEVKQMLVFVQTFASEYMK